VKAKAEGKTTLESAAVTGLIDVRNTCPAMSQTTVPESALEQFRLVAEMIEKDRVRADECAKARNERFNIFTTLLKAHDEVRLHTRFLHCLLDPKGFHDCDSRFLDLFFDTLVELGGVNHEDEKAPFIRPKSLNPWTVDKEASRSSYGQIDILLEQPGLFGIALENKKIYAGFLHRQRKQGFFAGRVHGCCP